MVDTPGHADFGGEVSLHWELIAAVCKSSWKHFAFVEYYTGCWWPHVLLPFYSEMFFVK